MPAFLGTNAAKFLARVSGNAGKGTRSPVPGAIVLSLSGRPPTQTLSCSLESSQSYWPC